MYRSRVQSLRERGWRLYGALIGRAWVVLGTLLALLVAAALQVPQLKFDATSETLVVEDDAEYAEYAAFAERFPSDEFVLVTLTPHRAEIVSAQGLALVQALQDELAGVAGVAATLSFLDVPYVDSTGLQPLLQAGLNAQNIRAYLASSPLLHKQLISQDLESAGIRVSFQAYSPQHTQRQRAAAIEEVRAVARTYTDHGHVHIGGVPLIAFDMMRYVRNDVGTFGLLSLGLMILALSLIFRRVRWVMIPLVNAGVTVTLMLGLVAALGIPVSVVSANFVAILVVTSIALNIHLIVRFRESLFERAETEHADMVRETMRSKLAPCLYTALTTVVAFTSLLTSGIPPVEDFGWMMAVGVLCAFGVAYLLFPTMLLVLGPGSRSGPYKPITLSVALGRLAGRRAGPIVIVTLGILALSGIGISMLSLDSKFSQYFKAGSDIRQGLEFIDRQFGGVLPVNFVIGLDPFSAPEPDADGFGAFDLEEDTTYPASAWFTRDKVVAARHLSEYLTDHPQVGSVTSLADLESLARRQTGGDALTDLQLAVMVTALNENRQQLVFPYANPETGELRLSVRMNESTAAARYPEFLAQVDAFASSTQPHALRNLSSNGMFILFGQSVHQLFESQLSTLLYVVGLTTLMFLALLRSLKYALVGMAVNVLAAAFILGAMGFAGLPLDMMTITIAAISVGIGVDDAFHYLHRYREEARALGGTHLAIEQCHLSIGRAIYFTSLIVIVGFTVLAFSNFVPTIYFGLLTALAMVIALLANLLVLPAILTWLEGSPASTAQDQAND